MSKLGKLLRDPKRFLAEGAKNRRLRRQAQQFVSEGESVDGAVHAETDLLAALQSRAPLLSADEGTQLHCLVTDVPEILARALSLVQGRSGDISVRVLGRTAVLRDAAMPAICRRALRANGMQLTMRQAGAMPRTVSVSFWERRAGEDLVVCRDDNPYAKRLPTAVFERIADLQAKRLRLSSLHAFPIDSLCRFDVDMVYTWVDHSDPEWRKLIVQHRDPASIDWDRYVSSDELRYSLRSIECYAPWVRKIYVVTNCRPPAWFSGADNIEFVPHEAVFPSGGDFLPTFNSHAIEACLMNVPGLAEHFLYFNDDVFLGRALAKEQVFVPAGQSCSFLEPYGMVIGEPCAASLDYLNAAINGRKLIEETFQRSPTQLHKHTVHALLRSVLLEMAERYAEDFARVRAARFRTMHDVSTVSFLYHQYAYQRQKAIRHNCTSALVRNTTRQRTLDSLLARRNVDFFCINDGEGSSKDTDYLARKLAFLEQYFPRPARWERSV